MSFESVTSAIKFLSKKVIEDKGIEDVETARQFLFQTNPDLITDRIYNELFKTSFLLALCDFKESQQFLNRVD